MLSCQQGGLLLHCLERKSGALTTYSVAQRGLRDVTLTAVPAQSPAARYSSLAHVTMPLEDCLHAVSSQQSRLLIASEQTQVPLTFCVHRRAHNQVSVHQLYVCWP